ISASSISAARNSIRSAAEGAPGPRGSCAAAATAQSAPPNRISQAWIARRTELLRGGRGLFDRLQPRRAVLELRDLAVGVELRVGQHVGGRFRKAERNKDHP